MRKVTYALQGEEIIHEGVVDPISSVGWDSKGCFYFSHLFDYYNIPPEGSVVQIGCALGCSLQILYSKYGERVWGIDPWNPLKHPRVIEKPIQEVENFPVAFVHCNAGDFRTTPILRKQALHWSLQNLVPGGLILTAGNHDPVDEALGFSVKNYAECHGCHVHNIPEPIAARTDKPFPVADCLIMRPH